jgi:PAS domain-containing protein
VSSTATPSTASTGDGAQPGLPSRAAETAEQPLELILARNLISIISLAAFLVDVEGHIVFYNDAAAQVVGRPFEETGGMSREQWNAEFGPFDELGQPLPSDRLPLTIALREGHPAYGRFRIRVERGPIEIEAGALPLVGPAGYHGAMVVFWPLAEDEG